MATDLTLNGGITAGGDLSIGNITTSRVSSSGQVGGTTGTFSGAVTGLNFSTAKAKITAEGGLAIQLTNETGGVTVKGQIVSHKGTVANAFDLTAVDANHCLGVVYESGIEDAAECWVVVAGIAQVLMKNASTMGHICRIPLNTDDGEAAGYAMDAAQSGTASVYKIGDVLETQNAEVLCKVLLTRY
jgi:hypothetical protein